MRTNTELSNKLKKNMFISNPRVKNDKYSSYMDNKGIEKTTFYIILKLTQTGLEPTIYRSGACR